MNEISEHVRLDVVNIEDMLRRSRHDPSPRIFLIVGRNDTMYEQVHQSLRSLPMISSVDSLDELKDFEPDGWSYPYLSVYEDSMKVFEDTILEFYRMILDGNNIKPVVLVSHHEYSMIRGILEENNIASHLFSKYELQRVSSEMFRAWLAQQFPIQIPDEAFNVLNEGIHNDFMKAKVVHSLFFDRRSLTLRFVGEDCEMHTIAIFHGNRLLSEGGDVLSIPSPYFILDTSAIVSSLLPGFVRYAGLGKWLYPPFIRKEVHRLEEKGKRGDGPDPRHIRSNLDLLTERFEQLQHVYPKARVRAEKVDSLLVDTALDTGAIVVTADIMISRDCGTEGVPVILFKRPR